MEEPPLKKQRLDGITDKKDEWDPVVPPVDDEFGAKYTREETVGITEFINKDFEGFDCILKYKYVFETNYTNIRYSDFVVNEIGMDGEVVLLKNTQYENPANVNRKEKDKPPKAEKVPFYRVSLTSGPPRKSTLPRSLPIIRTIFFGSNCPASRTIYF
jgi:hypothetical protein